MRSKEAAEPAETRAPREALPLTKIFEMIERHRENCHLLFIDPRCADIFPPSNGKETDDEILRLAEQVIGFDREEMLFVPNKLNLGYMTDADKIALGERVNNHQFWRLLLGKHLAQLEPRRMVDIARTVYDRKIAEYVAGTADRQPMSYGESMGLWDTHNGQLWEEVGDLVAGKNISLEDTVALGKAAGTYYLWKHLLRPFEERIRRMGPDEKEPLRDAIAQSFRNRLRVDGDLDRFHAQGLKRLLGEEAA